MSTDRQDIDLALATLERINEGMARGRIGATSRPGKEGGTVWKLDPRVEELSWVAKWWRDHRDEDVSVDDLIHFRAVPKPCHHRNPTRWTEWSGRR